MLCCTVYHAMVCRHVRAVLTDDLVEVKFLCVYYFLNSGHFLALGLFFFVFLCFFSSGVLAASRTYSIGDWLSGWMDVCRQTFLQIATPPTVL